MKKNVTLKGTNDGYHLLLNDDSSLKSIYEETDELLTKINKESKEQNEFEIIVNTGNRLFSKEEKDKLEKIITEKSSFLIKDYIENIVDLELAEQWYRETTPKFFMKNIRNGQIIDCKRDIVLFGDVRPGGVVRSSGNIIIIGNVQGLVHAGAEGDEEAVVIAPFYFDAQVRIGEHVEILELNNEPLIEREPGMLDHQIVYLNDLLTIEFDKVENLAQIRPHFAKEVGGFKEWQKKL